MSAPGSCLELAERCETAAGPNFQLEQDISDALFPERGNITHPAFTYSIYAALTLVPDGLPHGVLWFAADKPHTAFCGICVGKALAPALALCAAALRARAAQ